MGDLFKKGMLDIEMVILGTEQQLKEILVQHEGLIWPVVSYMRFQNGYCYILKLFYEGKDTKLIFWKKTILSDPILKLK